MTAARGSRLARLDGWQRERRPVAFVVAVGRKYAEDGAARNAARISYYAFFSVFPLLLVFVSLIGFVLQGNPDLRRQILDSAYADMPVAGPLIRADVGVIDGSGPALLLGLVAAVWAGLGVTVALGQAFDDVWGVPVLQQPGFVARRLRGVAIILVGGLAIVAGSVLGGVATSGRLGPTGQDLAGLALSVCVDAVALLAAFRLLGPPDASPRDLLPGVIVATLGLLGLQALGGWYVNVAIARATDTYGLFATVIGLLSWLSLAAHLVLVAAEVNAVRALGLTPRSLAGAMTPADRRALEQYAGRTRRHPDEQVAVRWAAPRDDAG